MIYRNRDGFDDNDGDSQSEGGFHLLGNCQKGAHAEKKCQCKIFHKNCVDEHTQVMFHHRLTLLHLFRLEGAQNPYKQTDQDEGTGRQQEQAIGDIPAALRCQRKHR